MEPLDASLLPKGVRARFVENVNGLRMHLLEAGEAGRPCVLLLHGFPELAYSWRKIMVPLAEAGFHVIAPDQRGYGRTTGWDADYDGDLASFRPIMTTRDAMGLLHALGIAHVACVVGHDYGSHVAGWCALLRGDIFRSLVLMSAPFPGAPTIGAPAPTRDIHADLAALARPRKHYHWYYSTRAANADMMQCPQGLHDFLRAYYHHKSADWAANKPFKLAGWVAEELAKMPTYYIMDRDRNMAETVAREMPSSAEIAANHWLPDTELRVYSGEYGRTSFQGGLNFYRTRTTGLFEAEAEVFSGRKVEVPACFISGTSDWGMHQRPGAMERLNGTVCTNFHGVHLIPGAGHWVQQEQPESTVRLLLNFLRMGARVAP